MSRKSRRSAELEKLWQQHLDRFQTLGVSVRQYCREHGISEASFYSWRRELELRHQERELQATPSTRLPEFVPVVTAAETESPVGGGDFLELEWPSGVKLKVPPGFDEETLSLVMRLAGNESC
jgi:hypothetical protein